MSTSDHRLIMQEIARHQARLRGFVRCLLVHPNDVDDILQDVNAVLWEKADDFVPGTDFWAWASQIARFKVLNQIRKYERERLVFDSETLTQLAEVAQRKLANFDRRRDALEHCLRELPPAQRQLVDLRYTQNQSIETISQTIARPIGSIRQTLYRIRLALLACIEGQLALESTS